MTKRPLREPVRDAPGPKPKNYITPAGLQRLKDEHRFLMNRERPAVTQVVAWAAGNGDRSENADYLYGKRRLRQIDSRIRFLTKRIDAAEVVDPAAPRPAAAATRVFFGATVTYKDAAGEEHVVSIVGMDEVDLTRRYISWRSPLARALLKSSPATASSCAHRRRPNPSKSSTSSTRRFRWSRSASRRVQKRRSGPAAVRPRDRVRSRDGPGRDRGGYFFGGSTVTISASVNVTVILSPTFSPSRFFLSSTLADIS